LKPWESNKNDPLAEKKASKTKQTQNKRVKKMTTAVEAALGK